MNLNNLSIKVKILSLAISIAIGISCVTVLVLYISSGHISSELVNFFQSNTEKNVNNLVKNVYKSCEITDQLLTKLLTKKLEEAKRIISSKGGLTFSSDLYQWNCINQFTKENSSVNLRKVIIGGKWIGYNNDFKIYQPVIDDLSEPHFTFTIFQRINEKGDMLRVATNVKLENGNRAIGTYIPATNPDGKSNPVLESVLNGITYFGNAYVVNDYYQTVYEPIKDINGKITGMLYTGVSLKATEKLRESILNTVVGKTGYLYVLGGSGARKGHYIISKNGERDGENIWETKDENGELIVQKIINQAISQPEGSVSTIEYPWKNKGDKEHQHKFVALTYFKPFDWVIGAGAELHEITESTDIINSGFNEIYLYFAIAISISLIGIFLTSLYISNKIAKPISSAISIIHHIAEGNIKQAENERRMLEHSYHN